MNREATPPYDYKKIFNQTAEPDKKEPVRFTPPTGTNATTTCTNDPRGAYFLTPGDIWKMRSHFATAQILGVTAHCKVEYTGGAYKYTIAVEERYEANTRVSEYANNAAYRLMHTLTDGERGSYGVYATEPIRVTVDDDDTLRILIITESEILEEDLAMLLAKTKGMEVIITHIGCKHTYSGVTIRQVIATIPVSKLDTRTREVVADALTECSRMGSIDVTLDSTYVMSEYLVSRSEKLSKWYSAYVGAHPWWFIDVQERPTYAEALWKLSDLDHDLSEYARKADRLTRIIPATIVVECIATFLSAYYLFGSCLIDNTATTYAKVALVLSIPTSIFLLIDALITRAKLSERASHRLGIPKLDALERQEDRLSYDGFSEYINETLECTRRGNDACADLCDTYHKRAWLSLKVLYFVLFLLYWMVVVVALHCGN